MVTAQQVREAIVAIIAGSAAVQAQAGRTNDLVIERQNLSPAVDLPAVVYRLDGYRPGKGEATVLLSAAATGLNASATAHALLEAAKAALDAPAFLAQGLDVMVFDGASLSAEDEPEGQPDLQQADWSLPLLVVD